MLPYQNYNADRAQLETTDFQCYGHKRAIQILMVINSDRSFFCDGGVVVNSLSSRWSGLGSQEDTSLSKSLHPGV